MQIINGTWKIFFSTTGYFLILISAFVISIFWSHESWSIIDIIVLLLTILLMAAGIGLVEFSCRAQKNKTKRSRGSSSSVKQKNINNTIINAQELVDKYSEALQMANTSFIPDDKLPDVKENIKDALVLLAIHSKKARLSSEHIDNLKSIYMHLADFVTPQKSKTGNTLEDYILDPSFLKLEEGERAKRYAAIDKETIDLYNEKSYEYAILSAEFDKRTTV